VKARTGIGFDAHPLVEGRPLVLGGVTVPFDRGLDGHSDGDVLSHAVIDALLGASGLGDIGDHFPSGDPAYEGIASVELLDRTAKLLGDHSWQAAYVDATIVAQRPVLKPFITQIVRGVAVSLGLGEDMVSVKATTTDHMGFTGRGEGIAALAVATVEPVQ
jgi:2-C-methyl-D-erythritol 2,4-cyclodiphosphate synthase